MKVRREVQGVIFRRLNKEMRLLLVKKLDRKTHRYRWRLLKGGAETGETERQALEREIFEEIGLRNIQILDELLSYSFIFRNVRHIVSSYSVEAVSSENIRLQTAEVAGYLWAAKQRAMEMLYWKDEKQAVKLLR